MTKNIFNLQIALILFFGLFVSIAAAQEKPELSRRGFFGAQIAPVSDEDRARLELKVSGGIIVKNIIPESSAEAAGVEADDVLLKIKGEKISSVEQFVALIKNFRSGDKFELTFVRGGREILESIEVKPRPQETHSDFDILYKTIALESGERRRVIITRPKAAGNYPALLFLGGVGCYSIDNLPPDSVHRKILYALTKEKNFVTMRVEKSGMGDSEGEPCESPKVDFAREIEGYRAGLKALKNYDFIKSEQIFLFGHSMGGVIAPVLAAGNQIKGVIVAETVGKSWFEYELENLRRQLILGGMPHDEAERQVRRKESCNYRLYRQNETPEQIAKDAPDCVALANQPPQPYTFMRQVADLNLAAEWKKTNSPVLIIYGTSDYLTTAEEHKFIASMLNNYRPNSATYVEIPNMNHGLTIAPSPLDDLRRQRAGEPSGEFNERFLFEMKRWLETVLQEK